ncbi:helix-turn-helix transcriptional regulator [Intestinimonas sp. MSJ-38]|uniref:helix-turn-helix transcriptional regulator n=1 Tax=Intestinimonas sp. MSJ-38 TaxID=2841532 RepID=UPI00209E2B73|nr:helix-turn-helix transcriptional regulator [Intestinimonas sp. MSJ-38]
MREWLRKLRNEKGLTMKDMGEKLGISESYYCAIENGDRQKKMDMMIASGLATIFEISVLSIVTYEEQWKN